MWQVVPTIYKSYWDTALDYCEELSLGGYEDWRLPNISELRTLIRDCPATESGGSCNIDVDDCLKDQCKDNVACSGCSSMQGKCYWPDEMEGECFVYWSSSTSGVTGAGAWTVDFVDAEVDGWPKAASHQKYRCVR